jgi:hypothetical protein
MNHKRIFIALGILIGLLVSGCNLPYPPAATQADDAPTAINTTEPTSITTVNLADGPTAENLPTGLPGAFTITGKVIDSDGLPIGGIGVIIQQNDQHVDAQSGEDGTFTANLPSDGNWLVAIIKFDHSSRVMNSSGSGLGNYFQYIWHVDFTVPQSSPLELVFEKATAKISGTVKDGNGNPVANASVDAYRSDGADSWGESDSSGYFELPAGEGEWQVNAQSNTPPYDEGNSVMVNIEPGVPVEPITLDLP